jgi:DNA-binding MarR family transcriptional regulator
MNNYNKVTKLYFRSINEFNEFSSIPRDFGTGDLLYSSEIHTLQAIGKSTVINLTDLSLKLDVSKSAVSKFVKKLLDKGLITKSKLPDNKKEVVFSLTEKGHTAYNGHKKFKQETFIPIFNILSKLNSHEIDFLERFLGELSQEVKKLNRHK